MADTRLSLYWFDNTRKVVMRADPDPAEGGVFLAPVEDGPIPSQDNTTILSVTRLRTGSERHVYWTTYNGGLWCSKGDIPDPKNATRITDVVSLSGITTFGDLTGNGNEDLVLLSPELADPGLSTVLFRENLGFADLGPNVQTAIPDVLTYATDTVAGRGNHPDSKAPWVFGAQGTARNPYVVFSVGARDEDGDVTFTPKGPVTVPGPARSTYISAVSLGDSDKDGFPDMLVCYYNYATAQTTMGIVPFGVTQDAPLRPYKALPVLGTTNQGGVMF